MAKAKAEKKLAPVESFTKRMEGANEVSESETIDVLEFVTEPAIVTVEYGVTINLGNYESARVHHGIKVPCYTEEIGMASKWAEEWVKEKVKQEIASVKGNK